MPRRIVLATVLAAALLGTPALAAAGETVTPVRLAVRKDCPVASPNATRAERAGLMRESALGGALATAGAKLIGELSGAALTAAGDALERASEEHGFVAEGRAAFPFYTLDVGEAAATLRQSPACLVLFRQGTDGKSLAIMQGEDLKGLDARDFAQYGGLRAIHDVQNSTAALKSLGLDGAPDLYVEAELIGSTDGFIVRPVFAWYRNALPGAPAKAARTELHLTFGTPSAADDAGIAM